MKRIRLILILLVVIACYGRAPAAQAAADRTLLLANPLYRHFAKVYPGREVVTWACKDLDNDGRDDLILIYKVDKEKKAMRVILNAKGKYAITNDVPAPVSNQVITFKDIDKKPPMEFIVQGAKGSKVGYAVYRIENGKLVDLFGEGMADCC